MRAATARSPSSAWTGGTWASCSQAGEEVFSELKNLCVWNKTNGGMGTFYRSKHELVFVFKVGHGAAHQQLRARRDRALSHQCLGLCRHQQHWANRAEELAMHPTVKPVALVADAIRDCSRRGEIVLDVFGGSGTTLIAAEKCGPLRAADRVSIPLYCDTIIRRWERLMGQRAIHAASKRPFEDVAAERLAPPRPSSRRSMASQKA